MIDNEIQLPAEVWARLDATVRTLTKEAELLPYISEAVATAGYQNVVLFVAPFGSSPQIVLSRGE